jgi:hypothetical protein
MEVSPAVAQAVAARPSKLQVLVTAVQVVLA